MQSAKAPLSENETISIIKWHLNTFSLYKNRKQEYEQQKKKKKNKKTNRNIKIDNILVYAWFPSKNKLKSITQINISLPFVLFHYFTSNLLQITTFFPHSNTISKHYYTRFPHQRRAFPSLFICATTPPLEYGSSTGENVVGSEELPGLHPVISVFIKTP